MEAQPNYKSIHKKKKKIYHKMFLLLTFRKLINQFFLILKMGNCNRKEGHPY